MRNLFNFESFWTRAILLCIGLISLGFSQSGEDQLSSIRPYFFNFYINCTGDGSAEKPLILCADQASYFGANLIEANSIDIYEDNELIATFNQGIDYEFNGLLEDSFFVNGLGLAELRVNYNYVDSSLKETFTIRRLPCDDPAQTIEYSQLSLLQDLREDTIECLPLEISAYVLNNDLDHLSNFNDPVWNIQWYTYRPDRRPFIYEPLEGDVTTQYLLDTNINIRLRAEVSNPGCKLVMESETIKGDDCHYELEPKIQYGENPVSYDTYRVVLDQPAESEMQLFLYDMFGTVLDQSGVYQNTILEDPVEHSFDMSRLPQGAYFLRIHIIRRNETQRPVEWETSRKILKL